MIGLDTNVLVRYIMQDDERQSLAGCDRTMTFDKAAAKSGGMVLL
jgi:predicted nucleic-acid-binding protein